MLDILKTVWPIIMAVVLLAAWVGKLHQTIMELQKDMEKQGCAADRIEGVIRSALYASDGQTVFMTRTGCKEKAGTCAENIQKLHAVEAEAMRVEIRTLCKKIETLSDKMERGFEKIKS